MSVSAKEKSRVEKRGKDCFPLNQDLGGEGQWRVLGKCIRERKYKDVERGGR